MSVETDLQSRTGIKRRLFARIDGLNYDFWQPHEHAAPADDSDWRAPLECLEAGEETSFALSLREMRTRPSGLSLSLRNIYDTSGNKVHSGNDANINYLFAKWFAPGAASIEADNSEWTYISGSGQLDADATTINVISTGGFGTAGTGYIGRETFTWTGKGATSFTGVTKGVYPCIGTTAYGYTYTYPESDPLSGGIGNDGQMRVADVPYSFTGRRVALYVTTYDQANGDWQTFADAELLWCGVIGGGIHYLAAEGKWQLDCDSIMKECERPMLRGAPRPTWGMVGDTGGFNMHGPRGLSANVWLWGESSGYLGTAAMTITAGFYPTRASLFKEVHDSLLVATESIGAAGRLLDSSSSGDSPVRLSFWAAGEAIKMRITGALGEPFMPFIALGMTSGSRTMWVTCDETNALEVSYAGSVEGGHRYAAFHPINQAFNGGRFYFEPSTGLDIWQKEHTSEYCYLRCEGMYNSPRQDKPQAGIVAIEQSSGGSYPTGASPGTYALLKRVQPFLPMGEEAFLAATEGQELRIVYGLESMPLGSERGASKGPFELLLHGLLSTGTPTYSHATYDTHPPWLSVAMQDDLVDTASFLEADQRISGMPLHTRNVYAVDSAKSWMDLLQRECKLFGHALVWRNGQLSLQPVVERSPDGYIETLSESNNAQLVEWPDSQSSTDSIINVWEIKHRYDYSEEKFAAPTTLADVDSIEGLGFEGKVSIEHPGLGIASHLAGVHSYPEQHLPAMFAQYKDLARHPWHRVSVSLAPTYVNRIFVGDTVRFQSNTVPDPFGSGSMACDAWGLVVDVSWDYSTWTGRASVLLYGNYVATAQPWAPSAMTDITATNGGWDAASYYLTLLPNEFSGLGDGEDGERFAEDDVVRIIDAAQSDPTASAYGWAGLVVDNYNATNQRLTFKNTPTLTGWSATAEHIVLPDDWGSVTTSQKGRGSWLGSASTGKLSTDAPYRYW